MLKELKSYKKRARMKRKIVLLTLGTAFIIALLLLATLFVQTVGNHEYATRVACVGDSITLGTGYTIDLWQQLGPNYVVGNFGVGGATVSLESNSSYMNQTAFQVAELFEPNIVIIMLGTNDANANLTQSSAAFASDYIKLINAFQELASKPKVWIAEPPPIYNNSADLSSELLTQKVIPGIQQAAAQTHLPLIDANTPLVNQPSKFLDGVHPNSVGAQTIAKTIYHALTSQNGK